MSNLKSTEQAALEFAEKRGDSHNLKMRDKAGEILTAELGRLQAAGFVAAVNDPMDNCMTYSLTDLGLRRLRNIREGTVPMQMTPAGQNQLDLMLQQLKDINTQMIEMNIWLERICNGRTQGEAGQDSEVAARGQEAQTQDGRGDGAAAAGQ